MDLLPSEWVQGEYGKCHGRELDQTGHQEVDEDVAD
jgi:hypothetical protein